ncbi:MAG: YggS family pyridoxal phosphate-dependent enzyme [Acidiferrobacteraceae bacterium]|jgi:pyridoxal phosphate enzyme (YggS family)
MDLQSKLQRVRARIASAAQTAGRDPADIRLVAVSKTHSAGAIRQAYAAGQVDFAENRIQEAVPKIDSLRELAMTWHFIGHLQRNKARLVPGHFQWLHTLDNLDLARRLSRAAVAMQTKLNCLIQVNVIQDAAKSGIAAGSLSRLMEEVVAARLEGIRLRGLMTIGPRGGSETDLRTCFATLRSMQTDARSQFGMDEFDQLSMGMTADLEAAILEGATMVRIGSGIFGAR